MGSILKKIRREGVDLIFRQNCKDVRNLIKNKSDRRKYLAYCLAVVHNLQVGLMKLHGKQ